jgi:hypothetical protein
MLPSFLIVVLYLLEVFMYPTHGEPFDLDDELFIEKKKEEKLERLEEDGLGMTFCGINSLVPNDNESITGFGDREGKPVYPIVTVSMGLVENSEGELVLLDDIKTEPGEVPDQNDIALMESDMKLNQRFSENHGKVREKFCTLIENGNIEDAELIVKELEELYERFE